MGPFLWLEFQRTKSGLPELRSFTVQVFNRAEMEFSVVFEVRDNGIQKSIGAPVSGDVGRGGPG